MPILDHIHLNVRDQAKAVGFRTTDLAAKTTELKAQAVKFTTQPRPLKFASGAIVNFAYLEGPAGAKVELVQR
jgi:hypothetical protein